MDPSDLVNAVRGATHADLATLEEAGLVATEYASDAGLTVRTVDRVQYRGRDDRKLGVAQEKVVRHLEDHGDATDAELRKEFRTSRAVLRGLVARGVIEITAEEVSRDPFEDATERRQSDPPLTPEQAVAVDALVSSGPKTWLLHGVTGSGKTEIYVRLTREVVGRGKRVLVLLPEIALTPQFVGVFRACVDRSIAVLHSGLTPGQKFDQWRAIRGGGVDVVIGARSALFAPLDNIGLIIVDEEHDPSFKQHEGVLYHARDAAVVLAHRLGALCVLGSATPSLETLKNAREGRYGLLELRARVHNRPLPTVDIVDLAHHGATPGDPLSNYISPQLAGRVRTAARRGEQTILFLNRRGFAPTVRCLNCGGVIECDDCDISLTYHMRRNELACHYCDYRVPLPKKCPTCQSEELDKEGAGTEQIAHSIAEGFSDLRVGRLDRDSSRGRGLQKVLGAFRRGELDVLVGTQMVTKGHDFPRVTVVGIVDGDQSLRFPDFRSGERTFQLLTQVAGRAGRAELTGEVILQTHRPEHYVIQAVQTGDYDAFANQELDFRNRLMYPPFAHLFALRVNAPDYGDAIMTARELIEYAQLHGDPSLRITGPTDSPIARVRRRYRVQAMVRAEDRQIVRRAAQLVVYRAQTMSKELAAKKVRWSVDIDAIQLL
jgi:primosomal protein N' (replication factor Y)